MEVDQLLGLMTDKRRLRRIMVILVFEERLMNGRTMLDGYFDSIAFLNFLSRFQ